MLTAIVRGLEERDQTHGHGARVAVLAEPVARELGWGPERIAMLRHAAPLQIDEDRSVIHALPPSPLIDTDDPGRGTTGLGRGALLYSP